MRQILGLTTSFALILGCSSQRLSVGADPEIGNSNGVDAGYAAGGSGLGTNRNDALAGSGASGTSVGTGPCARFDATALIDWQTYQQSRALGCPSSPILGLLAGGLGGPGNVDGVGASARFGFYGEFLGAATDGAGNLFVADNQNYTIRKVNVATGVVTTIAGLSGVTGSADGIGTAARFSWPTGVAADGVGNLFISDSGNNMIRKLVVATGEVTTFAGSPAAEGGSADGIAAAARFMRPTGLVADGAGHLFVSDSGSDKIRMIDLATAKVTTLAGSDIKGGSNYDGVGQDAAFYGPNGITLDHAGHLFVADTNNSTIRRIVIATGAVTTLTKENGWATLHEYVPSPDSPAEFRTPGAVVADDAGHLFVADSGNATIRVVEIVTGAVSTLAGSPDNRGSADGPGATASFTAPVGLTLDDSGNLLVVEAQAVTIRKVTTATGVVTTLAGRAPGNGYSDGVGAAARFYSPNAIARDGRGHVFVVDEGTGNIRKIDLTNASVTTVAEMEGVDACDYDHPFYSGFDGATFDEAGNFYFSNSSNRLIKKVDVATGTVTTVGPSCWAGSSDTAARFSTAALVADGAGHLFAADSWGHTIRRIDLASGTDSIVAGSINAAGSVDGLGEAARFNAPTGLALDGHGRLFVADQESSIIRMIELELGKVTTLAGLAGISGSSDGTGDAARFNHPTGLATDGLGNLLVADTWNHAIRKIVIESRAVTTVIGTSSHYGAVLGPLPAVLNTPVGLEVGPAGELFITDSAENAVLFARLGESSETTHSRTGTSDSGAAGAANSAGCSNSSIAVNGTSACQTSEYGLTCRGDGIMPAFIPEPDASLKCKVVPVPTPSNTLYYCCPVTP